MISPKGEVQNLSNSNSVAGENPPTSRLSNPNVHQLLIPGHLPNSALPKRIYLYSYGLNFPEGLLYQYSIYSSNGNLFGGQLGANSYSASPYNIRITNYCYNIFYSVPMNC